MDRAVRKDYEWLFTRDRSAYEILDVDPLSPVDVIRKAYRKKALLLHPDKNNANDAHDQFREVSAAYTILLNSQTKKEYDNEYFKKSTSEKTVYDPEISKFKSDLKSKEYKAKNEKSSRMTKRQKIEQLNTWYDEYIKSHNNSTIVPTSISSNDDSSFPTIVLLKWKNKGNINFDNELVTQLMQVFGSVESVSLKENNTDDNYHYANIKFESPVGAALASTHDFSQTADYWDEMNLRKISSLLRSVKLLDYDKINLQNRNFLKLSSLDYIAFSIMNT
ncbi:MAG: uncharacterized protein K0Q49_2022 [Haloplasmataceae bacterium]|jgi:curved DNA-binding protein CbpA|nr:uncharacterized protein [Haloplasmataceae bacterium]